MEDYYAARAVEYDEVYRKPERQGELRELEQWLPGRLAGRTVLELACGTGYWTRFIAPVARSVVALDAVDETLRIAKARVPAETVRLMRGDAYHLPFAANSFDAAFAGFWWSHVPLARLAGFLEGLHAVLRPGAKIVFIDNRFVAGSSTAIAARDAGGDSWQDRPLKDGTTHRVLKNFPSREALLAAVAPHCGRSEVREWIYFWALEYTLRT